RNCADPGSEIETTGAENELLTRVPLHLPPCLVGLFGQLDVAWGMVGKPDDSRVILRFPPHVAQLELLQAEHLASGPTCQPVGCRAPEAAETEHDVVK